MSIAEYAQNHGFPAQSSDYAKVLAALERERARSKRLEADLESARQALGKAEQKSTALSENVSSLEAAKASLELQMSSLRKDIEKSGEESARRQSTIDQLQSTVSDARTYNSGLEQANRQLRMTLETVARDELEDGWKTERTKLKEQNSTLETENRAYRAELASLRAIVQAAQTVSSTSAPAPIAVAPPQSLQERIEPLRSQRCAWLNRFPRPYALPKFVNIEPIQELKTVTNILNKHAWRGLRNGRRYLNLVGRAVWTDPTQRVHLLCYSPTRYYHRDTNRWVEHAEIPSLLQQGEVDVFISCDTAVIYAGVFQAHSFRAGGPPSLERIPADVSKREMLHNMNGRNLPSETVPEDALLVECLGLQCVGFDEAL
ncbi:hypothetical protein MKEN_00406700 [Mycena kentingensis (nom. inval.)]|nr:hypothetical protein MKEN_00406700 [Mycena kentingensis (nom. inval.)]